MSFDSFVREPNSVSELDSLLIVKSIDMEFTFNMEKKLYNNHNQKLFIFLLKTFYISFFLFLLE